MKRLTPKEEEIMQAIWRLEKAFAKDVREALPEPKPHINTVSTVMRKLVKKGFLGFEDFGATHRYFAKVAKEDYSQEYLGEKLAGYFGDSYKEVVAFFAKEEKVSVADLKEIIRMIENPED
ncbi:MAG: BlaI/MecI/CopY family transcriptional regulator [Lewinellaceae bacterium]|nr:BlaI/MecI/CopY family transcriptional regulator [Lewinella sp.]MCB9277475.1 BlaI/MecI/CopY family transcriptional regulator [Lewinellaceae bacterium]